MTNTDEMLAYKEQLYEQFGLLGHAFSSSKRLELIDLLCQGERSVENLAQECGLSVSNVSQHLKVLKTAKLVESRKDGLFVYYYIADPSVAEFWSSFCALALNRLAEIREVVRLHLDDRDELEPIGLDELRERISKQDLILLDVRPVSEFQAGRIPGALSIPLADLQDRLDEIPAGTEVAAYCRGPFCVMAVQAVEILRRNGIRARRFEDGIPEWQARGLPVDRGHGGESDSTA